MIVIQRAEACDVPFLVWVFQLGEGYSDTEPAPADARLEQRMAEFTTSPDKAAWVAIGDGEPRVGLVMCRFRDLSVEGLETPGIPFFLDLPDPFFTPDARFCEVFELWVAPEVRRRGIGTRLKGELEGESRRRGIRLIYTHTETTNPHVIDLNFKMGYREIRRGPIWDEVERVSLVKDL